MLVSPRSISLSQTTHVSQNESFGLQIGQSIVRNGGFETGDFTDWTLVGDTVINGGLLPSTLNCSLMTALNYRSRSITTRYCFSSCVSARYGNFLLLRQGSDRQLKGLNQFLNIAPKGPQLLGLVV